MIFGSDSVILDLKVTLNYIVAALRNGNILVFDRETKEIVNILEGHQYDVNSIDIYNDDRVISGGYDYSIYIRDLDTADTILVIKNAHSATITKIKVFQNYIVSGSSDAIVKVRNIKDGKLLGMLIGHSDAITDIDVNEEHIVTSSLDGTIKVWNLKDFSLVKTLKGHKDGVIAVMFTEDYIVSLSKDKSIKVWKYYE